VIGRAHGGRGFTLVESVIAMILIGLVLTRLTIVVNEARRMHSDERLAMALEDQAAQVLDQMAYAVIGADAETITPGVEAPFSSRELRFRISLGVEDGQVVWGEPEEIGLRADGSQLYWGQSVGAVEERIVVWCNTVTELLDGELLNGFDDNENGLADEFGLSFDKSGRCVTIRLTLEEEDEKGNNLVVTRETVVTCRN